MGQTYGKSFAKGHIERGDYEDAVTAATKAISDGDEGPEPYFDRGVALDLLERHAEAVTDFERAIEINARVDELDAFALDDAYFSAVLAAAKKEPVAEAKKRLARYRELLPHGEHVEDSKTWEKRVANELPSLLDKTADYDRA
jgi:tetratricopeptide (TPR) repeat protein